MNIKLKGRLFSWPYCLTLRFQVRWYICELTLFSWDWDWHWHNDGREFCVVTPVFAFNVYYSFF